MIVIYEGAVDRIRREHNSVAWLAWHTAYFSRIKKMPDLRRFIHRRRRTSQTPEQQETIVRMMHAALTGETRH